MLRNNADARRCSYFELAWLCYLWFTTQNNKLLLLLKTFDYANISLRLDKTISIKILLLMTAMNDLLYLKWLFDICLLFGYNAW